MAIRPGAWYYPNGRIAVFRGQDYAPNGRPVQSLRNVITADCGPYDPDCERNLASAAAIHPAVGTAAELRFAWQSRHDRRYDRYDERPAVRVPPRRPPVYVRPEDPYIRVRPRPDHYYDDRRY